ncbi:MAG: hypothetical protein HQP61_10475 [Peptococcaceae bacterium]|nr:hypothetical protein [Candidatus Syntrophopropionicum ammoniitolerans]
MDKKKLSRLMVAILISAVIIVAILLIGSSYYTTPADIHRMAKNNDVNKIHNILTRTNDYHLWPHREGVLKTALQELQNVDPTRFTELCWDILNNGKYQYISTEDILSTIDNDNTRHIAAKFLQLPSSITHNSINPPNFSLVIDLLNERMPNSAIMTNITSRQKESNINFIKNDITSILEEISFSPESLQRKAVETLNKYKINSDQLASLKKRYDQILAEQQEIKHRVDSIGGFIYFRENDIEKIDKDITLEEECLLYAKKFQGGETLTGFVVAGLGHSSDGGFYEYEIIVRDFSRFNTTAYNGQRAILQTKDTNFQSKGNFQIYVLRMLPRSRKVTTIDGFIQNWPVFTEKTYYDMHVADAEAATHQQNIRDLTQEKNELLNQLSSLRDELKTATSDARGIDASLQQIEAQWKSLVNETSEKIIPNLEMIANNLVHFNLGQESSPHPNWSSE